MYILPFTFFPISAVLRSREVSSTTFCVIEKTLYLLYSAPRYRCPFCHSVFNDHCGKVLHGRDFKLSGNVES